MICFQDKRSLIVQETFNLEKSYVESLQFLVLVRRNKLKPNLLKVGIIISLYFYLYLEIHESFEEPRKLTHHRQRPRR